MTILLYIIGRSTNVPLLTLPNDEHCGFDYFFGSKRARYRTSDFFFLTFFEKYSALIVTFFKMNWHEGNMFLTKFYIIFLNKIHIIFRLFFKGNFTNIVIPLSGRPKNVLFFFKYTKRNKPFEKLDWEVRFLYWKKLKLLTSP